MKRLPTPKNLTRWLNNSQHGIGAYYQKAQQLIHLNKLWNQHCDFSAHSQIVNYREMTLVLAVESGVWATHFHYNKHMLLEELKRFPEFRQFTRLEGYVQKPEVLPERPRQEAMPHIQLSSNTKKLLRETADVLHADNLKTALYQLSHLLESQS